ncbi:hypothetical protein MKX01_040992 [Papaver californicum]|nr:hypothetical protein MKX01_040992 [Papaver californicum]
MASPHSSSFLTVSILLFVCFLSVNALKGGITEIKDVKTNKEVQALGKYSVDEYNLKFKEGEKGILAFQEVVKAQKQVISGMKYFLKVSALEDGTPKLFDAVVVVKAWKKPSNYLISFEPSNSN